MRSSTLIAFYLWKDTWKRWFEQPGSVLARASVTVLTVGLATLLLVAFSLLERSLKQQLESFGLSSVMINESFSPGHSSAMTRENRFSHMQDWGQWILLRQLYISARLSDGVYISIYSYGKDALLPLAPLLNSENPCILVAPRMPERLTVDVEIEGHTFQAVTRRPLAFLTPVFTNQVLLVPENRFPLHEAMGCVYATLLLANPEGPQLPSIEDRVEAIEEVARLDNTQLNIRSSLDLHKKLKALQDNQLRWRLIMAAVVGTVLSLIFGTISLLEFRQNLFIGALLRSFGTPGRTLFLRTLLENIFIANLFAVLSVVLVALMHGTLFKVFQLPREVVRFSLSAYLSKEIALIFLYVNIGACLSTLPVHFALKKPVGEILS